MDVRPPVTPQLKVRLHPDHPEVLQLVAIDGDMWATAHLEVGRIAYHASPGAQFAYWPEQTLVGAIESLERLLGVEL